MKTIGEIREARKRQIRKLMNLRSIEVVAHERLSILEEKNHDSIKMTFRRKGEEMDVTGFDIKIYGDFGEGDLELLKISEKVTNAILLGFNKMENPT